MLNSAQLEQYFLNISLPEEGRQLVRRVRDGNPARTPKNQYGNSVVWYASRKMHKRFVRVESRTIEAPAAAMYDMDDSVLEFYAQPTTVPLTLIDQHGRRSGKVNHTPDFMVLRKTHVEMIEWKQESRLRALEKHHSNFQKNAETHTWHYRPAEEYFSRFGVLHRTLSDLDIPRVEIANYRFLDDYFLETSSPLSQQAATNLQAVFDKEPSVRLKDLIDLNVVSSDDIFKAVITGLIFVDLKKSRLDFAESLILHRNRTFALIHEELENQTDLTIPYPGMSRTIEVGTQVIYHGKTWKIRFIHGQEVGLQGDGNAQISLLIEDLFHSQVTVMASAAAVNSVGSPIQKIKSLADASTEELELALRRREIINDHSTTTPVRTRARWAMRLNGLTNICDQLIALIPRFRDRGNRSARISEETETLMAHVIRKFYNTPEGRSTIASYSEYARQCAFAHVEAASIQTFRKHLKNLGSTRARAGKRKDYSERAIPLYLDCKEPVHGVLPHEVCYVDHTVLNLATTGPNGSDLGKPYLSLAVDGATTLIRAFFVGYWPPSSTVVLLLLRDYVRRHNRLPKILVLDGGAEFRSKTLTTLCRIFNITMRHRPPGKPRGGTLVERAFGALETDFIAQLEGNTRILKEARITTKSVEPFRRRRWTLVALWHALDEYFFKEINLRRIHPVLGITRGQFELNLHAETGQREHVKIPFDENVVLMTSPHGPQSEKKVNNKLGVWSGNRHYWNDAFKAAGKTESVEVRIEPWNHDVIYAHFRGRWIAALFRNIRRNPGITPYAYQIALREERRQANKRAADDSGSATRGSRMHTLTEPANYDPRLREQEKEQKSLYLDVGLVLNALEPVEIAESSPKDAPPDLGAMVTPDAVTSKDLSEPEASSDLSLQTVPADDSIWDDFDDFK